MNKIESYFVNKVGVSFFKIISLLLALFFLWGFALGLMDVLNKHFQDIIQSNSSKYGFVLLAYYAGYFLMPLPASMFNERFGYKNGIIFGLILYALGAFMFFPTSQFQSFPLFLLSLFCISLGMATLETVVNPYTTLVGKNKYSTFRITLGHSFTALGWFFGPLVGNSILFDLQKKNANEFASIAVPYVGVGILVLLVAVLFLISNLPKINEQRTSKALNAAKNAQNSRPMFKQRHFIYAVITMGFYLAAQTAIFGFYAKYLVDLFKSMESHAVIGNQFILNIIHWLGNTNVMNDNLYYTVSGLIFAFAGMGLFVLGRFFGSFILIRVKPNQLLLISSFSSLLLVLIMSLNLGVISFFALCLMTLSISTMFPIIFSLGIRKMGNKTKRASAYIIMSIVGGSTYPIVVAVLPNVNTVNIGLVFLFVSFVVVFLYGLTGYKIDEKTRASLNN